MIKTTPREYQKEIASIAAEKNTLVVLPTGLGKTLIALLLAVNRKEKYPLSKILFLAPTRPLVEQHIISFRENLSELYADLQLFTGSVSAEKRKKIWQTAEIIFSTPQCIANDLQNSLYTLSDVSLIIIDEAHRCLKNYDYTKVIEFYKGQAQNQRILGLTASPGHEPEKIKQICTHLDVDTIEIRTRNSPDVKPYLQSLEFRRVDVPFPKEFIEIRILLKRLWDSFVEQLKIKGYLSSPANKISLLQLQTRLALQVSQRNFSAMYGMSLCAKAIKISHAMELLETQTLSGLSDYFHSLQKQADEKKSKAVQALVKMPEFNAALLSLALLLSKGIEHPKVEELAVLTELEFKESKNTKIIIFTQFRDTAAVIKSRLSKLAGIIPEIFVGQAKKKGSGLSQKEQHAVIEKFKSGEINVLVATSIAEEGLDIPEVNAVIFYEPIPSAIRKIQRAGRTARLSPGKLFILITKDTRDEIHHYASGARERKMHKTIEIIKKELEEKKKAPSLDKFLQSTKDYKP